MKIQQQINQKSTKNRPTIFQKTINNPSKHCEKSIKSPPTIDQNHHWSEKCRALRLGSRLGCVLEASWARLRGQDSSKLACQSEGNSIKIDQKFDAFQVPVFMQFWWIFALKMEACWHKNHIKNRCQLRKADFAKSIEKQNIVQWFLKFLGWMLAPQIK